MRIGVIGWYGYGNAGDERMLYAIRQLFLGHELLVVRGFEELTSSLTALNQCDFVLFGGGGLILRGTGKFAPLIDQIHVPFACLGISIEAEHADNRALIDLLREKSRFIHVRDADSARRFSAPDKVLSGVDVTFLCPFPVAATIAEERCAVNFRPWRYWLGEHGGSYDIWMWRIHRRWPWMQHIYPFPQWRPRKAVAVLQERFADIVPVSFYDDSGQVTDMAELQRYFAAPARSFDREGFAECRYLVGMRLHALIFAIQQAIPFVSLSYQPKNLVLCNALGLDHLSVPLSKPEQLTQAITVVQTEYSQVRERLLAFREKAHARMQDDAEMIRREMGC